MQLDLIKIEETKQKISFIPFAPISKPEGSDSTEVVAAVNNFTLYHNVGSDSTVLLVLVRPL